MMKHNAGDTAIIEAKRLQRQLKKAQKVSSAGHSNSVVNEHGFSLLFTKRTFRPVTAQPEEQQGITTSAGPQHVGATSSVRSAFKFRLISYNILAQTLVRRKLFPNSGEALKWKNRQFVLKAELGHYQSDVLCLQEVGLDMLDPWLLSFFRELDYEHQFHCGQGKNHGILIAWRKHKFTFIMKQIIAYNDRTHGDTEEEMKNLTGPRTNNVGLVCLLKDIESQQTVMVATTHLYFHPLGTAVRARQLNILIRNVEKLNRDYDVKSKYIIAGDLNTEPTDPTYQAVTTRPFSINCEARDIMVKSSKHIDLGTNEEEDGTIMPDEFESSSPMPQRSEDVFFIDRRPLLNRLAHGPQLRSLYGVYGKVNDRQPGSHGEPACTNFAHLYRGTLDYIMTSATSSISCRSLLEMPDIRLLSFGQPQEGQFPSDHFAIGCEVVVGE